MVEKAIGQQKCEYGSWGKSVKILITFLLVNFAWIFFRMPTIGDAWSVIARIFNPSLFGSLYTPEKANTLFMVMGVMIMLTGVFDAGQFIYANF